MKFKNKKIHFIGIKGAGMAGLAKLFKAEGAIVSGSDIGEEFFTDEILKKLGLKVEEFNVKNISKNLDWVIYSTAYQPSHPEIKKAGKLKIPLMSYSQALGFLFNQKIGIAVCGTHGKSTSAGMLGKIFKDAGLNPTVLVGGEILNWKTGALAGRGKYFISEADEYQAKFLSLKPKAILITNIEYDHPDYFKNFTAYKNVFKKLVKNIKPGGLCVGFGEDKAIKEVLKNFKSKKILFSPKKQKKIFEKIKLQIPGEHNRVNALGVFLTAKQFGISEKAILKSLKSFKGMRRRLEYKNNPSAVRQLAERSKFLIIDDYAHHPTEIKASLLALRETFSERKIIAAFQPHTFSRTKVFLKDFGSAFFEADKVLILDIYGSAREKKGKISSRDLVKKLEKNKIDVHYTPSIFECRRFFKNIIKVNRNKPQKYILLTMGAGDVWKAGENLI